MGMSNYDSNGIDIPLVYVQLLLVDGECYHMVTLGTQGPLAM